MAGTRKAGRKKQPAKLRRPRAHAKSSPAHRGRELAEARQRLAATAEILKIISSSPAEPQPVFDAIAHSARKLLGGRSAVVVRRVDDVLYLAALTATTEAGDKALREMLPAKLTGESFTGKAVLSGKPMWVSDIETDPAYSPAFREGARKRGIRSHLAVPMVSKGFSIGAIIVGRRNPGTFSEHEISLLQTFAEQAVIAIENARLFNETKEALERQTATAEILRVISGSPTDVQPVLDSIAERAATLCGARFAFVTTFDGEWIHLRAAYGPGAQEHRAGYPMRPGPGSIAARVIRDLRPVQIEDMQADPEYAHKGAAAREGFRSGFGVPMLRDGRIFGCITVTRTEPGVMPDRLVHLLQTFADQAVIALENVRLFNETKEALEQQTATAEVLRLISHTTSDLQPILDALLATACRLCDARNAMFFRRDPDGLRPQAWFNTSAEYVAARQASPIPIDERHVMGRVVLTRSPVHVPDVLADPTLGGSEKLRSMAEIRTVLGVPVLSGGEVSGTIAIYRTQAQPFTAKQIRLLNTFADQAAIAIENVRLFNETKEALERQTATADILRVISGTPTDVQPVFDAIVAACAKLFPGHQIGVNVVDEQGHVHLRACEGSNRELLHSYFTEHVESRVGTKLSLKRGVAHFPDVEAEEVPAEVRGGCRIWGVKAIVYAPMVSARRGIGAIWVGRGHTGPFSDKEIALLATFAEQAVIAIQNARQFNETKEALERQTATASILKVISESPTDVQPVLQAIVASAARLFGCNAVIQMREGDVLQLNAAAGPEVEQGRMEDARKLYPLPFDPERSVAARAIATCSFVEFADTQAPDAPEFMKEVNRRVNARSVTLVPLVRKGVGIGALGLGLPTPGFRLNDGQRALAQTFADQAVIAIENVRLFNETREALERQTATAEILEVMSRSQTDLQPVFDAIAANAMRLCGGDQGLLFTYDGELIHIGSIKAKTPEAEESTRGAWQRPRPQPPHRGTASARALLTRAIVHVPDVLEDPEYELSSTARAAGWRSVVSVPMMRGGDPIGAITVTRRSQTPFADDQIALLKTFADQAVIAIENVRLFNETKEALERQTATAEILEVMSRSQSDLRPMFDTIAANAQRLCAGDQALVAVVEGGLVHLASIKAMTPEEEERTRRDWPRPPGRGTVTSRAILTRTICHVSDVLEDPEYELGHTAQAAGWRSVVSVPMVREGNPVGTITVMRRNPIAFSDAQIALLKTFADQAVIAIENVRLFNETREALRRQTATAEVLKAISQSTFDLQRVLTTLVENATRLCEASHGFVFLPDGATYRLAVAHGASPEFEAHIARIPVRPERGYLIGRVVIERRPVQIVDALADPDYREAESQRLGGYRTMVGVPMLKGGEVVGVIVVWRQEVRAFSDKQIELLTTFADQAVIAIENVRLFNETKEALEQQTATSEILRVISSTPTEVQPVFDAICESAMRIFSGMRVAILLAEGDKLRIVASGGNFDQSPLDSVVPLSRESASGLAVVERRVINIHDTEAPDVPLAARDNGRAWGFRAAAVAPLLRESEAIGAIIVFMRDPVGLSDKQVALLKTFADQAVIAIENTRLFKELEARTEALTRSVGQLKALGDVGRAISSTLDLSKVLQTIVARAVEIVDLDSGAIYEYEEDRQVFRQRSALNVAEEIVELFRREPLRLGEGAIGHAGLTREPVQIPDMEASYQSRFRELLLRAGWRALLVVPLLSEGRLLGALTVARNVAGEFAPEVVDLLRTFATQSAIAIQNARLFREIEEKSRQLEVASRHKSDFLASMSHELRTPLNAILGFNEMILEGVYGDVPADMTEPLADIQTSGKHLLRLINNVLDLAKIEAGRMELALADYSAQDVVESVRATLRPLAEAKGLEFLASVPQDLPLAHGDSGRLTQCLMNLAGNSLKFTKAGRVAISVEQNGGATLVWRVADTGIGIPPDKIGSLFTEFRQTDATIASEYGGTGLGLSITRKFVEMHGGRIWVESEPGKGSTFIFEVPIRAQTA